MLSSQDGTVTPQKAEGISRMGRATQGVRVMNVRDGDHVSSIARVTEPDAADVDGADIAADVDAGAGARCPAPPPPSRPTRPSRRLRPTTPSSRAQPFPARRRYGGWKETAR